MLGLVFWSLLFWQGIFCRNVYISRKRGYDNDTCSSESNPCQTLDYTFKNILRNKDKVFLESSSEANTIYHVNETLEISFSFSILNASHLKPIIQTSQQDRYIFKIKNLNRNMIEVNFSNLYFKDSKIIYHSNSNLNITFYDSIIEDNSTFDEPLIYAEAIPTMVEDAFLQLSILNNQVNISQTLLKALRISTKISLKNTRIKRGGSIYINNAKNDEDNTYQTAIDQNNFKDTINGNNSTNFLTIKNVTFLNIDCRGNSLISYQMAKNTKKPSVTIHNVVFQSVVCKRLLNFQYTNISIDDLNINKSTSSGIWFIHSNVTAHNIYIQDCGLDPKLFIIQESKVYINNINISKNNVKEEAFFVEGGKLDLKSFHISGNQLFQVIYVRYGSCVVSWGEIIGNTAKSTFIGAVSEKTYIELSNLNITANKNKANVIHLVNVSQANISNLKIENNEYISGIQLVNIKNTRVENVTQIRNIAKGRWKAFGYYNSRQQKSVFIVRNFYARIGYDESYKSHDTIMEVDISNSMLNMKNVVIDLKGMWNISPMSISNLKKNRIDKKIPSDILIKCPVNYNPSKDSIYTDTVTNFVYCTSCKRNEYHMQRGCIKIDGIYKYIPLVKSHISYTWPHCDSSLEKFDCKPCPPGGQCDHFIASRSHFYGFVKNETDLMFLPCPSGYCCSSDSHPCKNITTCNTLRTGVLCGRCQDGYYENYLSTTCTHQSKCTKEKQNTFWSVFFLTALVYAFGICFGPDFVIIIKHLLKFSLKSRRDNRTNDDISNVQEGNNNYQERKRDPKKYTISGLVDIIITFYQLQNFMTIDTNTEVFTAVTLNFMSAVTNLKIFLNMKESVCPFKTFNAVNKLVLKKLIFPVLIIFMTLTLILVTVIHKLLFRRSDCNDSYRELLTERLTINEDSELHSCQESQSLFQKLTKMTLYYKAIICFLRVLIIGYGNMSIFAITAIHCIPINDTSVLYIEGGIKCFQTWQYLSILFLVLWVIPFPLVLSVMYYSLKKRTINISVFMLCLVFPILTPIMLSRNMTTFAKSGTYHEEEFRCSLYEIFEEPYRKQKCDSLFWWQTFKLYERLLVAVITVVNINPIIRICYVTPILLTLLWLHIYLQPYQKAMTVLKALDISVYICLCYYLVKSTLHSVVYIFDVPIAAFMELFLYLDFVFLPIVYVGLYFTFIGLQYIWHKIFP